MVKRSATSSKFPIARIKRIMQADEDVGKVAQATPVVIFLELFMQDIVVCAAGHTRQSGGKRVTPYHLKRAIETNETFDFLKEIVEKVADPVSGGDARGAKRRKRDAPAPKEDEPLDHAGATDHTTSAADSAAAPAAAPPASED
ncbi:hypothetical protein MCUN1_003505 [Malassezia cuniculi]|uniref:Transcription factor CBF/NF-Y/archaeal histone domain-containing protein n=1 Tax=Malassezia cuniculi TaxID=948313 RepID=A0AAF0EX41_9BASI|nr:hypothetical protein MCUN1_003505 [Malassezia cuniculi]